MVAVASLWMIRNAPDTNQDAADTVPGVRPIASLQFADCYAIPRDARGDIMTADGVYVVSCDENTTGRSSTKWTSATSTGQDRSR